MVQSRAGGIQFFRLVAFPLVPPPDSDKDGVPDLLDKCPGTPAGLTVDPHGCPLIRLATHPESIAGEPMQNLSGLLGYMREFPRLNSIAVQIEDVLLEMDLALGRIRGGAITGREPLGVEQFSAAASRLRLAYSNFVALIPRIEQELLADTIHMPDYADIRPQDTESAVLRDLAKKLLQHLEGIAQAEDTLKGVARSITGLNRVRAEIAEINDAERWIKLDSGRMLALPDQEIPERIAPGTVADIEIQEFEDGTGVANSIKAVKSSVAFPSDVPAEACLYLQVLPVQEFPPISNGPFVKHQLSAYQHEDLLFFEAGMRLAVESGNCPKSIQVRDGTIIRYRMKLDLYYKPLNGPWGNVTLASSLGPASTPVPLPEDASAQYTYTLTATVFRQECPLFAPGLCSEPEDVSVTAYSVRIYPRYAYGTATYENTVFELEDSPEETSFRTTRVNGITASGALSGLSQVHFLGQAFTVFGPQSSYPNFGFVSENQLPFAIYESDIVDQTFFKETTLGTTNRAAMYWPRLTGYHNGHPFWYTCKLPVITRDAVSICPNQPHAFYRLPFKGGWPTWAISQGNLSSISHTGTAAYAYDFAAPANTKIRAARGGVVESLAENLSENTYDPNLGMCTSLAANFVAIRHQDGTVGRYGHMPQNGVLVSVGQKVRRGDLIALVGETGCASGTHVHFEVRNASGSTSIASRFEAWGVCSPENGVVLPCLPLRECYVPDTGQGFMSTLFSNNKPWWE